jgi:hypothetical protein
MKIPAALCCCLALVAPGTIRANDVPSEAASAARIAALDVAGAFSNDGFKLRDGFWSGQVDKGGGPVVMVNLFAGNHYWFAVAASGGGQPVLEVFDEQGRRTEAEAWKDTGKAAAGLSPAASGPYYVRVRIAEGGPAEFCMVYSYK